jgi:hypothetical protein
VVNTNAPEWGEIVNDLQMACALDTANGVVHGFIRNVGTNAIAYNDCIFGGSFNLSLEIRQPHGWVPVTYANLPAHIPFTRNVPKDAKIRWLQPGQTLTNTWVKENFSGSRQRTLFVGEVCEQDTCYLDLEDKNWDWPALVVQPGTIEARIVQKFCATSADDPFPYVHGPDLTLYSRSFTMDCGMLQVFLDPRNRQTP